MEGNGLVGDSMTRRALVKSVAIWAVTALSGAAAIDVTGTGVLSGTVLDEARKPVAGSLVTIFLEMPAIVAGKRPDPFAPFSSYAITGKDGTFSAGSIPKGALRVCASVAGSDYLDDCRWLKGMAPVTITQGQKVQLPAISLSKGYRLKIRVDDAQGAAVALTKAGRGEGVVAGVFTDNGLFAPARPVGSDKGGFDLDILVPFDTPLHVSVSSKGLALADGLGKAADALRGIVTPLTIPSGGSVAPIRVAVTGAAATAEQK